MGRKITGKIAGKAKGEDNNLEKRDNNLGLDADHSSDDTPYKFGLDNDSDRKTYNPDGEDDNNNYSGESGHSPLSEK